MQGAVVLYERISQDRTGEGLGVTRQDQDGRALAAQRGWPVDKVYRDNDASALRHRPHFETLLAEVEAGQVSVIICWSYERLVKTRREEARLLEACQRHEVVIALVRGSDIDTSTPSGRLVADMLGSVARMETDQKADRQRRANAQRAEKGQPHFGGLRPFGYADDRVTVLPVEAGLIREAARRVLGGEALTSVCADWKARGVTTPTGGFWQPRSLRRVLGSARISGRREVPVKGQVLGEIVGEATWEAIIPAEDSDRLRRKFTTSSDRWANGATGRTYLLSGILRCGLCGSGLAGRPRNGVPRYMCPPIPGARSCGRIATNAARTDEHVTALVLAALDSPALTERFTVTRGDDLAEKVAADEAQLRELAEMYANREITRGEWVEARAPVTARLEDARRHLDSSPVLSLVASGDVRQRWDDLGVGQRRAVVAALVERVDVHPADPGKRWDPDRFGLPVWRV